MSFRTRALQEMRRLQAEQSFMITLDDERDYRSWRYTSWWAAGSYTFPGFRVIYYKLFPERVEAALRMCEEIGLQEVPGGAIVSIGCGFGAELVAAYDYLERKLGRPPMMKFVGVDPVGGWEVCFNAFRNNRFEFWIGELSNNEYAQRILCDFLWLQRTAYVILAHVVLDFAEGYIGDFINKVFKIETLRSVIIMERTVYNTSPDALQGCRRDILFVKAKSWYQNYTRQTKVVVYKRVPVSDRNVNVDYLAELFGRARIA